MACTDRITPAELEKICLGLVNWEGEMADPVAEPEKVNHPAHYGGDTTYEAIKVIEAWGAGFCLGNCLKYICRALAGIKGERYQDLLKARWYLNRAIEKYDGNRIDLP